MTVEEISALASSVPEPVLIHNEAGSVVYWNAAASRTFGWTLTGPVTAPGDLPRMEACFNAGELRQARSATLETGKWQGDIAMESPGDTLGEALFRSRWMRLRPEGTESSLFLTIGRYTSPTIERSSQAAERAQRLQTLGETTGGIAHDLNNMLQTIILGLGLAKDAKSPDDIPSLLQTMETSAERMRWMIEALLRFSRGTVSERVSMDLGAVAQETMQLLKHLLSRQIQISLKVPETPWKIRGDATQISQILMNLAINARDAMPEGGKLTFSVENTHVRGSEEIVGGRLKAGAYVVLTVADTGTGMPPEVLEKVFVPFFTTKVGRGTGLGLSNVYSIIKSHEGEIHVYSEVGKGSKFTIYFPASASVEEPQENRMAPASRPRGNGELILVAEDETAIRALALAILQSNGYRVIEAKDGKSAVETFKSRSGEIRGVLLDYQMPGMNGKDALAAMRAHKADVRIILCSGLDASVGDEMSREPTLRPNALLSKPFKPDDLLHAVANLLKI